MQRTGFIMREEVKKEIHLPDKEEGRQGRGIKVGREEKGSTCSSEPRYAYSDSLLRPDRQFSA